MAQSKQLIDLLKRTLKTRGKTYLHVAEHLGLSEASVKRLFAQQNISLKRLDEICALVGLEISDLAHQLTETTIQTLSFEQEKEIVADIRLLVVTVCVLNRWSVADMTDQLALSEHDCIRLLAKLDRMGMIDLLPENRVRLKVRPNFRWLTDGPIQQFFLEKLQQDFFASRFDQRQERLLVVNGMLSDRSVELFQKKMTQLVEGFDELNGEDVALPLSQRHGVTVVLAMRRWGYGLFSELQKKSD